MVTLGRLVRRWLRRRGRPEPATVTRILLPGAAPERAVRAPLPALPGEYAPGAPDAQELAVRRVLRDRTVPGGGAR